MEKPSPTAKEMATQNLITIALNKIEERYGTGQGDGETPLKYHNLTHALKTLAAARTIAKLAIANGKIAANSLPLIELAAAFHDYEQGLNNGENEEASAQAATKLMSEAGLFSLEDQQAVTEMIMGTRLNFENGRVIQAAESTLAQIVADADVCVIGDEPEEYRPIIQNLAQEIKGNGVPSAEEVRRFAQRQAEFIQGHEWHTPEAEQAFPHKQDNLELSQEMAGL